jgi:hypothetical protein
VRTPRRDSALVAVAAGLVLGLAELATLGVAAAAALSFRRLPRGRRAAVAGSFGALAAAQGARHLVPGTVGRGLRE